MRLYPGWVQRRDDYLLGWLHIGLGCIIAFLGVTGAITGEHRWWNWFWIFAGIIWASIARFQFRTARLDPIVIPLTLVKTDRIRSIRILDARPTEFGDIAGLNMEDVSITMVVDNRTKLTIVVAPRNEIPEQYAKRMVERVNSDAERLAAMTQAEKERDQP